ncbi:MAG: hypothetical protein AAF870_04330 [Pseudomonadota bacterium]
MRDAPKVEIADKGRLLGISALIGSAIGVPFLFILGFSGYFLIAQPLSIGVCAGLGIMSWRVYFPIGSAQIAAAAAVAGGAFLVVVMLIAVPLLVGVLLPSILVISVAVGFLTWHFRTKLGLEVFFEPRQ